MVPKEPLHTVPFFRYPSVEVPSMLTQYYKVELKTPQSADWSTESSLYLQVEVKCCWCEAGGRGSGTFSPTEETEYSQFT